MPLPGTKRYVGRENPHSLFYSSLFTKSPETPINTGVPRGEELASPFTTLHHSSPSDCARNWNGSLTCSVGGWNHFFMSHRFHRFTQIFPGEGWVKSGEEASALFTLPKQLIHKSLRHSGEGWRVFLKLADYRYKLQRNLCKSVKSVGHKRVKSVGHKKKLSVIRRIKYSGKAYYDTGMPIRPTENKKVDFQQKIHLLHYIIRFVHLFSVYFVYFCGCVWIAAGSNFQKLRLHATSK